VKIRSVMTLVGLAICSAFVLPAFAQQKDAAEPPIVQQRDLLGVAKAIGEFGDLHRKLDEAYDKNDAAGVAALFTEDGLFVAPDGMFSGRQDNGLVLLKARPAPYLRGAAGQRFMSDFGPNPYRGFGVAFRVVLITKQSRGQTFRTPGALCPESFG
jgi:hypothetical protein